MKQLGLAAHNYQSANNCLPAGADGQNVGCLVYLLPYIEQESQFHLYSFRPGMYMYWYQDPLNRPPPTGTSTIPRPPAQYGAEGTIKTFLCPAAPAPESYSTVFMACNYGIAGVDYPGTNSNSTVFSSAPGNVVLGRSNYLGSGGYYAPSQYPRYRGIFTYNYRASLANIPDGTSNTFMFIEYVGGESDGWPSSSGIPNGVVGASWSAGFNYTGFGTPSLTGSQTPPGESSGNWLLFGSNHTNHVVNVTYADGSVRQIDPSIDFNTWVFLSGMADGMVVSGGD